MKLLISHYQIVLTVLKEIYFFSLWEQIRYPVLLAGH